MDLVDRNTIQTLRELEIKNGSLFLDSLIDMYIENLNETVNKMSTLLENKSFNELYREAHTLKSSSANLGIKFVEEISKVIEYKIIKKDFNNPEEFSLLIKEISNKLIEIANLLTELKVKKVI